MFGQTLEVLDGGGQQELIAGTREAAQSEANHRENVLGLAERYREPVRCPGDRH